MQLQTKHSLRGAASGALFAAAALCFGLLLFSLKTCGSCGDVPFTGDPTPLNALLIILGVALAAIIAVAVIKAVSAKRAKRGGGQPTEETPEEKTEE